jgi:hypothetical protein
LVRKKTWKRECLVEERASEARGMDVRVAVMVDVDSDVNGVVKGCVGVGSGATCLGEMGEGRG